MKPRAKALIIGCLILSLIMLLVTVTGVTATPRDFYVEVSKGNIPGHTIERLSGINPTVGNSYEDIISSGGNYVYPTEAVLVNVASTDADDKDGESGAWNVTIEGLGADWGILSETIQLNGIANVTSANLYIRINHVYTRQVGPSGWNEGTISVTSGAMLLSEILPNHGEDQYAIYSVPANCSVIPFSGIITSSEDKAVEVELQTRLYGESWLTNIEIFSYRSNTIFNIRGFKLIPEMTDIKIRGKGGVTAGDIGATLNMLCITDDVLSNSTLAWGDGTIPPQPTNYFLIYMGVAIMMMVALLATRKR